MNTYKKYGLQSFKEDSFLTIVGSISSVAGGIRFIWPWIVDKHSYKLSYFIVLCLNIVFGFTFVAISHIKGLYLLWVCVILWSEGAHFALVPVACAKLFGEHATMMYGIAFSFGAFPQIISSIMVKFFLKDLGYEVFYYFSATLSVIALVLLVLLFREKPVC